ncbi:hypothetical protein BC940DRAFT_305332 [Gongronella butleri]|nr:hypothetical protein BC940DRAFT_305332 [Gongronella butleri]
MHIFPDEVFTKIFEFLPVDDLKTLRLCKKHWSILSSPVLFKKAIFCLSQPQTRQMQHFAFFTTPLTCSNDATPGHLVRDLFLHHQHDVDSLKLLPRLNRTIPWIKHLDINHCQCNQTQDSQTRTMLAPTMRRATTGEPPDDTSSSIDVNASWQTAMNQWSNLQSVAIRSILVDGAYGPRLPAASTLVTHLDLSRVWLLLDVTTFLQLPSLFPSLHFLSCSVKKELDGTTAQENVSNALLQHLRKLRANHETRNHQWTSNDMIWPSLDELNLLLTLKPLDACYLLLVLVMMVPNLTKLSFWLMISLEDSSENMIEMPLEAKEACLLNTRQPLSLMALRKLVITNVRDNELMASALFLTTQQLEHIDVGWTHKALRDNDNDNDLHDYTPEHTFFRHLAQMRKPTIRHFSFENGGFGTRVHQLLHCIDVPAFAQLVTLEIAFIKDLCMDNVLDQMPQLEELYVDMPSCGDRDTGAPVVQFPTCRVPHALKIMELKVLHHQFLGAPQNIENINPGVIRYLFDFHFCFDPSTMAPDQDDTLFAWLAPGAQKMVMDLHHWACAPGEDVCLSWACFPSCHLAELDIERPRMHVDDYGYPERDCDDFGAVVVYQANPGPGVSKLHLYYAGDDGRQLDKPLRSELDLVDNLKTHLPDLQRRQKENRQWRWEKEPDAHFEAIGPATATVLIVLATRIDNLKLNVGLRTLMRTN